MAKRTGFPQILTLFYWLGRPFFWLFLLAGYLLIVGISILRLTLSFFLKTTKGLFPLLFSFPGQIFKKIPRLKIKKPVVSFPKIPPFKLFKFRFRRITFPKPKLRLSLGPKSVAFLLGIIPGCLVFLSFYFYILKELPSPQELSKPLPLTTKILDRNGQVLYKIYRNQNRTKVSLADIPLYARQATTAIEDKDFYRHSGFDLRGITRAVYYFLTEGKLTGGSTITQQLVKNTLLNSEKTLRRKLKELILAILVEKKYTKDEILEMYLNEVGYGGATYGIEEASQKYFGKSVKELTLAQAALLAGLPASPTAYSPFGSHPEIARLRQSQVLSRMVEDGYLSENEAQAALKENINYRKQEIEIRAPHFVMYVKELLAQEFGERLLEEGGLEVLTSLDLQLQEEAQEIVKQEIEKLKPLRITNGAALVTNPKTGEILAMVGSKDYQATDIDGNFNVTTALRQPGSAIKPVNYSLALERGFTPSTLISDTAITYRVAGQPAYSPKNYDNRFHGNVSLRTALGSSYNIPAVKILSAFGVEEMVKRGQAMGITDWNDSSRFGLSLTLGGGEVKMTDLAVVYGTIANYGKKVSLNPILEVKDSSGKILKQNPCLPQKENFSLKKEEKTTCESPVLNAGVAWLLTNILADNSARTPAFGPNSLLVIPHHEVAVKTGTTQNMRDNWTIGYTPSRLVAVWVGNNNNAPMSYVASGVTGASPIWNKIMNSLLKNQPNEPFAKPEEIISGQICILTGTLSCEGCPSVKNEYFLKGTEPKNHCDPEKIKQILEEKARLEEEQKKSERPE